MEAIATEEAPAAIGPYSQAIAAGSLVFCSGQIPLEPQSGSLVDGGVAEQTRQVLRNLSAVLVAAGFVAVNALYGSFLEPRYTGQGLGLSTLVVFISLVFWGWVLGPVGMLLSVPLTMVVKIALESRPDTRWIGILLGSAPPSPPEAPPAS